MPANSIFSAPITSPFNAVCLDENPSTCQSGKKAETVTGDEVLLNVLRCQLTYYWGQAVTNAEAWFNIALRPRKPEGSLGRTAQDGHLDSHTVPEL